jgi:hypothetical protein
MNFFIRKMILSALILHFGDFNFSLNGTLEFDIEGKYYLSPPSYGLWLPPRTEHQSLPVEHEIHYICIRLHPRFGDALGDVCRCFSIQPFFALWSFKF